MGYTTITGNGNIIGDHNIVTITYQGVPVIIPSPEAVAAHRVALRQWLVDRARGRWGEMSAYIQEEGAALPLEASPYDQGHLGARENLLSTLHSADRLLVLGEPGAGKTVALERLAWELCDGPDPLIPVMIPLFNYAGTPLAEWVRAKLKEQGCLRLDNGDALEAFLETPPTCCFFLFDGLNEVAPPYRDTLVDHLTLWMEGHPRHTVICTSRSQDEIWGRLRGEVRTVVVQPIEDAQVEGCLVAHLGDEKGRALYARLDDRLRAMARRPLLLWLIQKAGEVGESIPGNRGELYARFVSRILRRDTERRMDTEIPESLKHQALAELAYALGFDQRLFCSREEATAIVSKCMEPEKARSVIEACLRHGLLAGEETIAFAPHQTVQEYFAAEALLVQWERERGLKRTLRFGASLLGIHTGILRLAVQDWWMETFVQLAGLSADADALAAAVLRVNPWLAWWCVEEGREVNEKTKEAIAARSVKLLDSKSVSDRRRAVGVLARLRNDRAIGPLFKAAGDADAEVAGMAVQALDQMGEAARLLVEAALQGTDHRRWKSALRYLFAHLDDLLCEEIPALIWRELFGFEMVYVSPGSFWMGSNKVQDPAARDSEVPKHKVTLPGYWIAKTPVTVAQFRTFVEAEGYKAYEDALKGPDDHPVVWVSWNDALVYCHWLSKRTGLPVTLPSEAEWEKAARGTDGRLYPWGNTKPDARQCNFGDYEQRTTPVGRYSPRGDSPYRCVDMAGNVWEWTRSLWGRDWLELDFEYPYDAKDGRENLESRDFRVLRGGAFFSNEASVRCAWRYGYDPNFRYSGLGFRPVLSPYL
jgi:formylglycine-generating enzyme required for sulfatase activity